MPERPFLSNSYKSKISINGIVGYTLATIEVDDKCNVTRLESLKDHNPDNIMEYALYAKMDDGTEISVGDFITPEIAEKLYHAIVRGHSAVEEQANS